MLDWMNSRPDPCLVLSIMHGGTHFVKDHLLKGCPVKYNHIGEEPDAIAERSATLFPIFVPLRHPLSIALTWLRRGQKVDWLPVPLELLATEIDALNPWYIPLDTPDRDSYIEAINSELSMNLDPQGWPLIGHDPHVDTRLELSEEQLSPIREVLERHSNFFGRWYKDL